MGIRGVYVPFKVESKNLGQAIQSLRTLNIAGANISIPYKESVIPYLDILSEGANIIGAINTIVRKGNELKGYNTNAIGFMDALNSVNFDVEGKTALVIGTGGAAKAVAFIFNWLRTERIIVAGRNARKAANIVKRFRGETMNLFDLAEKPLKADIIVNATSVSSPDESPELFKLVERFQIKKCEIMIDLNYGRKQNLWREMAERNKIPFMDGLKPLAFQARRTLSLWTGMKVPPEEFIRAVKEDEL